MKREVATEDDHVAFQHVCLQFLEADSRRRQRAAAPEPTSIEDFAARLKKLLSWARENCSNREACAPLVEVFESIYPADEVTMNVKLLPLR